MVEGVATLTATSREQQVSRAAYSEEFGRTKIENKRLLLVAKQTPP